MTEEKIENTEQKYIDVEKKNSHALEIASFVLGILSLVGIFAFITGILGIVFSSKTKTSPMGRAGFIMSLIGLVVFVLETISCIIILTSLPSFINNLLSQIYYPFI